MTIFDKLLVEQAWHLQLTLKRCIETPSCKSCIKHVLGACENAADLKGRILNCQKRAYNRYVRRLQKLWVYAYAKDPAHSFIIRPKPTFFPKPPRLPLQ
jgi:hypothetical protein